jgi:hypothetical protein
VSWALEGGVPAGVFDRDLAAFYAALSIFGDEVHQAPDADVSDRMATSLSSTGAERIETDGDSPHEHRHAHPKLMPVSPGRIEGLATFVSSFDPTQVDLKGLFEFQGNQLLGPEFPVNSLLRQKGRGVMVDPRIGVSHRL